ncbi:exodeoxyribonuclease VII small subunit [Granulicella cerasi]|uniref:Exodeoxyribonuclease 7 small subunit n=1 Tax=Granulicella cerasi TaxID=741063 RepID=A0ABW1ZE59_9BACT|nr:exodeoxyribonuclease VII small subunit [Granulicella cerasi]
MASFENDLGELEKVVDQLERGDLPLEESVALFERGIELSRSCKSVLANAEARLQRLVEPETSSEVRTEDIAMAVEEGEGDEEDEYADDEE